jgi:hypothetical protein
MLLGVLFMASLAGVDALRDRSSKRPLAWSKRPWWARRKTRQERASVAISIGKWVS